MIDGVARLGDRYQPAYWYFAFTEKAFRPWMRFLPSRLKHVTAFAPLADQKLWVLVDAGYDGTEVAVFPDAEADAILGYLADRTIVRMPVLGKSKLPRWGYWCTALCGHLVGLDPCALLPDGLLKQCLDHGGVLIDGRNEGAEEGS
jgi:hypothetical protein